MKGSPAPWARRTGRAEKPYPFLHIADRGGLLAGFSSLLPLLEGRGRSARRGQAADEIFRGEDVGAQAARLRRQVAIRGHDGPRLRMSLAAQSLQDQGIGGMTDAGEDDLHAAAGEGGRGARRRAPIKDDDDALAGMRAVAAQPFHQGLFIVGVGQREVGEVADEVVTVNDEGHRAYTLSYRRFSRINSGLKPSSCRYQTAASTRACCGIIPTNSLRAMATP